MMNEQENTINCSQFEELLTDYLDKTLDSGANKAIAEHALRCPLCHALLNDVKSSLEACRSISAPAAQLTLLEARVLSMTTPETTMPCDDFESWLTDYLDGFLPANLFHRWERHAALCTGCSDMPGMVVRSIAACYTYKMEELAVPEGLRGRILQSTIGTTKAPTLKASWSARASQRIRALRFPIPLPQLAPLAMMLLIAFMFFSQAVSADGSLTNVYQQGFELAEQTYKQSADVWNGTNKEMNQNPKQDPLTGMTYVDNEEGK